MAAVLSGNRNFEGRIHRGSAGQLPRLAAAGRRLRPGRPHGHRPEQRAAWARTPGRPAGVPARRLADASRKCRDAVRAVFNPFECSTRSTRSVQGRRTLEVACGAAGRPLPAGSRSSTYVKHPPYFEDMGPEPPPVADIHGARVSWRSWATASPPTTSRRPARSRRKAPPATT